jgi:sec-independent protein translocase protein TatA
MGAFSVSHWLIVLLVVLLLFGPKKISEMGKGLGQGLRNFKSGLNDEEATAGAASAAPPDEATPVASPLLDNAAVAPGKIEQQAPEPAGHTSGLTS